MGQFCERTPKRCAVSVFFGRRARRSLALVHTPGPPSSFVRGFGIDLHWCPKAGHSTFKSSSSPGCVSLPKAGRAASSAEVTARECKRCS